MTALAIRVVLLASAAMMVPELADGNASARLDISL